MKPSVIFNLKRDEVRAAISHYSVVNPRIFGSVLHGNDQEGSDIDLLVDALPGTTLFDIGGLQDQLETLLNIPVDIRTPYDLPTKFRFQVLAEAQPV